MTITLAAIIGSLRADSFNRAVFEAAVQRTPDGHDLTELDISSVPFYDGDVEAAGDPAPVAALKRGVSEADGLVIFTPEYNRSVPAVTKNAIDWLSRLPGESVLRTTTVGIVAATPGRHDAAGVRDHLATSVNANTDRLFPTTLGIGSIGHKVEAGVLTDTEALADLTTWLAAFGQFVSEHQ